MSEPASIKAKALQLLTERRQAGELATVRADQVEAERVRWVWPGFVPAGKVTVVDGDPGLGKSTFTLDLAARLTTASPLPDGHRPERPMAVLLLSAEDGVADTIRPRLEAAGANLRLVTVVDHVLDEDGPRPVELPADADRIERWCKGYADDPEAEEVGVGLTVIDPLMAYLAGEVNAHRDHDVRRALHPLKLLAERTGVAVLVVRHLNKMTGASALYRGGGSIGIVGAARAGLLVGVDPQDPDRRILAVSKSNLAAKPPSLAYRLAADDLYGTAKVVWEGTSDRTAEDLVGRPVDEDEAPALAEAVRVLKEVLADGPLSAGNVKVFAAQAGVAERTLQRARRALGVTARRQGFGPRRRVRVVHARRPSPGRQPWHTWHACHGCHACHACRVGGGWRPWPAALPRRRPRRPKEVHPMTTWPAGTSVTLAGHTSRAQQADSLHGTRYALQMSDLSGSSPTLHLTAVVTREGDWYVARCLEIDAVSQGETVEQALANLRDVVEVYVEEEGLPPAPTHPLVTSIDVPIPA